MAAASREEALLWLWERLPSNFPWLLLWFEEEMDLLLFECPKETLPWLDDGEMLPSLDILLLLPFLCL